MKYGADNHIMEVLITFENTELTPILLDKFETCYIEYFDCMAHKGLNLRTGGRNYTYTDQAKENMRNAKLGKPLSTAHKESMKLVHKNNCIAVEQYSLNEEYINSFPSIGEAAEKTGSSRDGIRDVCRCKKYSHTCGGFKWKFKNNNITI